MREKTINFKAQREWNPNWDDEEVEKAFIKTVVCDLVDGIQEGEKAIFAFNIGNGEASISLTIKRK